MNNLVICQWFWSFILLLMRWQHQFVLGVSKVSTTVTLTQSDISNEHLIALPKVQKKLSVNQ